MAANEIGDGREARSSPRELLMRYYPAALALSLLAGVTSSVGWSAPAVPLDPRALALEQQGRAALSAGNPDAATDAFEAALAVQPGHPAIVLDLAEAARRQGMQGKALRYYRDVLDSDPQNLTALAGEGAALAEKGAFDKARRNLARLEGICGSNCAQARLVAEAIAHGPAERVVSAETMKPQASISN
ncbi:MAG: tetratricopeptide repeat protein [Sphingomonadales bacterium]|nr:tetratricopeptide repeat protein [Sphingomonadales bacterium]